MSIMAVHDHSHRHPGFRFSFLRKHGTAPVSVDETTAAATATGVYVLAGLRLLTGFVFLWAFLDKTFGFGHATQSG
jgi:thiosulfate dehydrogenase [quinone] large subunit